MTSRVVRMVSFLGPCPRPLRDPPPLTPATPAKNLHPVQAFFRDLRVIPEIRPLIATVTLACSLGVAAAVYTLARAPDVVLQHKRNPAPWNARASPEQRAVARDLSATQQAQQAKQAHQPVKQAEKAHQAQQAPAASKAPQQAPPAAKTGRLDPQHPEAPQWEKQSLPKKMWGNGP